MPAINAIYSSTATSFASQVRSKSTQTSDQFAQILAMATTDSAAVSSLRGTPASIGTYNSCGKITKGGPEELLNAVRQAKDDGFEVSPEISAKLCGSSPEAFMEALGEITGQTPAQVMTSLLNMTSSQAAALASGLAELTGADASSFTPMLSKLTGHSEAMIMQCLNSEEDDEENGDSGGDSQSAALDGLKYQNDLQSVSYPSIDVTV